MTDFAGFLEAAGDLDRSGRLLLEALEMIDQGLSAEPKVIADVHRNGIFAAP